VGESLSDGLRLAGEAATLALGAAAARGLPDTQRPFVLTLAGDLGAGKTTFARGLLQALGVAGPIRSPSYGLLEHYDVAGWQVLHLDLYRLRDPQEIENLGVRDHHVGRSLWLVEWPEKGAGHLPSPDARLDFTSGAHAHHVEITACSEAGEAWLSRLAADTGS
jgi:tRNA threonylcarbamoyladenosine biosynthesis protein TsaE